VTQRILVARIGAPHGVRGEVRLFPFTQDPAALLDYAPLTDAEGRRSFTIAALRPGKDHFVARLKGIDDRTAAEALTNLDLYVPRDALPPPEDEETFYHADLIGLAVMDAAGERIGTVVALHDFGAGDILEYAPARAFSSEVDTTSREENATRQNSRAFSRSNEFGKRSSAAKTAMVPFSREAVPVVDIAGGRVVIAPAFIDAGTAQDPGDAG